MATITFTGIGGLSFLFLGIVVKVWPCSDYAIVVLPSAFSVFGSISCLAFRSVVNAVCKREQCLLQVFLVVC